MPGTNGFAKFIDELRDSRNMSRENFAKGIISIRQYYRYIRGESSLKDETINKLLERLEINSLEAHAKFIHEENVNLKDLNKVYSNIRSLNYKKAERYLSKVDYSSLESNTTKKYYKFLQYSLDYYKDYDLKDEAIKSIIELIDYPSILEKDILTFYELSALFFVADYLIKIKNDYRVAEFTYDVLINQEKHYISHMPNNLISLHASSARYLGKIGEFEKSLNIAKIGIQKARQLASYNNLANLLLYKAVSEKNLRLGKDSKESLTRLFSLLKALDDEKKSSTFKKYIQRFFDIKESDLIKYK